MVYRECFYYPDPTLAVRRWPVEHQQANDVQLGLFPLSKATVHMLPFLQTVTLIDGSIQDAHHRLWKWERKLFIIWEIALYSLDNGPWIYFLSALTMFVNPRGQLLPNLCHNLCPCPPRYAVDPTGLKRCSVRILHGHSDRQMDW